MQRTAEIEVTCTKDKAGKVGIAVYCSSVKADVAYVEDMRELWEVKGRGILSRLLKNRAACDRTYHVTFTLVAEADESGSYGNPNVFTRDERVLRGQNQEAWLRANLLEGLDWWAIA